ncbi:MAG TPA: ABC transporter permease subunit [Jatrophihabitans sp.]
MKFKLSRWGGGLGVVILLVIWAIISVTWLSGLLPSPLAVVKQAADDGWSFYWPHVEQTCIEAVLGYAIGVGLALVCAMIVLLAPVAERVILQLAVASYCIPVLAIGPILTLAFGGITPKVALAVLLVFFTTLVGMLLGLRSSDKASLDLITVLGGGRWSQMTKVRLISALPASFAALKVAAPGAMIGAILGDYLGGDIQKGIGVAMTVSQAQLQVPRTWALAIIAGLIAAAAYAVTGLVGKLLTPWAGTVAGE